jgi:hypothetical protein
MVRHQAEEAYDLLAQDYAVRHQAMPTRIVEHGERFLGYLTKGTHLLDVGGGAGALPQITSTSLPAINEEEVPEPKIRLCSSGFARHDSHPLKRVGWELVAEADFGDAMWISCSCTS